MNKILALLIMLLTPSICFGYFSSGHSSFGGYHSSSSYHPVEEESYHYSSTTNLLTHPAYSFMPVNIYHGIFYHHHNPNGTSKVSVSESGWIVFTVIAIALILIIACCVL